MINSSYCSTDADAGKEKNEVEMDKENVAPSEIDAWPTEFRMYEEHEERTESFQMAEITFPRGYLGKESVVREKKTFGTVVTGVQISPTAEASRQINMLYWTRPVRYGNVVIRSRSSAMIRSTRSAVHRWAENARAASKSSSSSTFVRLDSSFTIRPFKSSNASSQSSQSVRK